MLNALLEAARKAKKGKLLLKKKHLKWGFLVVKGKSALQNSNSGVRRNQMGHQKRQLKASRLTIMILVK